MAAVSSPSQHLNQANKLAERFNRHKRRLVSTLQNDVHPLFAKEKFEESVNYKAILPSLQLVTRLLSTPQMNHFFGTLFFGELKNVGPGETDRFGCPSKALHWDIKVHEVSAEIKSMVDERLLALASMVRFGVRESTTWLGRTGAIDCIIDRGLGVLRPKSKTPGYDFGLLGPESRIHLSEKLHQVAEKFHNRFLATKKDDLWVRLQVASVILHELGHAANRAVYGRENYLESGVVREMGYEIESSMWGYKQGPPSLRHRGDNPDSTPIVLTEWPNKAHEEMCEGHGQQLECRDRSALVDDVAVSIPESWVFNIFQEGFWSRMGTRFDARALIPSPIAEKVVAALEQNSSQRMPVPGRVADLFRFSKALRGRTGAAKKELSLPSMQAISERYDAYELWSRRYADPKRVEQMLSDGSFLNS